MAETLISPGVLARENDQSQITSQPIQAGGGISRSYSKRSGKHTKTYYYLQRIPINFWYYF